MKQYDVAVCGGGIAGVAAALAAARRGKRTILIEKQAVLGGLATSGLIYIYLPISDDRDHVIASSITEELLIRCQEYGPFSLEKEWGGSESGRSGNTRKRYLCCFSPAGYMLTLEKMVREAGVELRLETTVTETFCNDRNQLEAVEVFCGSEKENISAASFVDATGGAFVCRMAGAKVFYEKNFTDPWFMEINAKKRNIYHFTGDLHIQFIPRTESTASMQVATAADMQEFMRRQYDAIRNYYDVMTPEERKYQYPVHLPMMPQTRKIARINGYSEIKTGEAGKHFADSIGVAADWREVIAPAWETPYGALLPKEVGNVLAAGRCINSSGDAWEIFRVIPAAAMTGEAAGIAAALAAEKMVSPQEIPAIEIQKEIIRNGGIIHIADGYLFDQKKINQE